MVMATVSASSSWGGAASHVTFGWHEAHQARPTWAQVIVWSKSPEASCETGFAVRGVTLDNRAFKVRGRRSSRRLALKVGRSSG